MRTINLVIAFLIVACGSTVFSQNIWTQKTDYGGTSMFEGVAFTIGSMGYVGIGPDYDHYSDLWQYDPEKDTWMQKADFPAGFIRDGGAASFSIGTKGYVGTGYVYEEDSALSDFWEYDSEANVWTQKADFGGGIRAYAVGFSIGDKGYIGTGIDEHFAHKDFWEYNPNTDTWTQKADYGGAAVAYAESFIIQGKGYVGTGGDNSLNYRKDFWQYDPVTNTWTKKADFGGTPRLLASGFSIGDKGYIGIGQGTVTYADFWEYDATNDLWTQIADCGGGPRTSAIGIAINGKGYVGTGVTLDGSAKDFWEYSPDTLTTCEIAAGKYSDEITSNSAKLHWSEVSGAEGYKVRYKIAGTNEWKKKTASSTSKKITELEVNTSYIWEVKTYCTITPNETSDWSEKQYFTTLPERLSDEESFSSFKVYPNPFSTSTTISFSLVEYSKSTIELFDLSGRKVKTLFNGDVESGVHEIPLNGEQLDGGIYLLQMKLNDVIQVVKIVVE